MNLAPVTISCPVYLPAKAAPAKTSAAGTPGVRRVSRFDAAETGPSNRNHWSAADDLSPNTEADPETRRVLRKRARYERNNDPHMDGLVKQLANDLIGTGPRLQLQLDERFEDDARLVERRYADWCRAIGYADKLRVMHEVRPTDGESFGLLTTNPQVPNPVKLDLKTLEADEVDTPFMELFQKENAVSGIEFDADGNPAWYHVLKQHPGDTSYWNWSGEYTRVAAQFVVHWYRPRRPRQARGICEFASALPVGSQTRRYSAAVLSSAEYAASINAIAESDAPPPNTEDPDEGTPDKDTNEWVETKFTRDTILMAPGGMKVKQLEAEQPTGTYVEFVTSKRGEMGRPVLAPLNLVTGDSSNFNFASGRLDHLPYQGGAWIERDRLRDRVLDRVFLAWYAEARMVGQIPATLPPVEEWGWDWQWDAFPQLDPVKETAAAEKRLELNLSTLAEESAARGTNWRENITQRAKEMAAWRDELEKHGLTIAPKPPAVPPPSPAPDGEGESDPVSNPPRPRRTKRVKADA